MPQAISTLAELPPLEGFNFNQGLGRVMGNFSLYFRLLKELKKNLDQGQQELKVQLAAKDLTAILSTIHKIKGVSGNLGGEALQMLSANLEIKLKECPPNDFKQITQLVNPYIEAVKKDFFALSSLDNLIFEKNPPAPKVSSINNDQLQAPMREILILLRQSNTAAQETFEALATMLGPTPQVLKIKQLLDNFDFIGAEHSLLELTQSLAIKIED